MKLTLERFILRASTWSSFGHLNGLWDLTSIIALTPRADPTILPDVVDTIRVMLWFAGAHPGYGAKALLDLADARDAPTQLSHESIFRWLCEKRARFYHMKDEDKEATFAALHKQYMRAMLEPEPVEARVVPAPVSIVQEQQSPHDDTQQSEHSRPRHRA